MRILLVSAATDAGLLGDSHENAVSMAVGLRSIGHDVQLFTTMKERGRTGAALARWESRGVPTVAVAVAKSRDHEDGFSNPAVAGRFEQVVDVVRPDVLIFHALRGMGIEMVEAALERKLPAVAWLPDAWWLCQRQFMIRSSGQWCGQEAIDPRVCSTCVSHPASHEERQERSKAVLNRCARILVPSPHWRSVMAKSGIREDLVFVLGNGIASQPPALPRSPSPGPMRFGFAGGNRPESGHHHVVDALRAMIRSDYELHVLDSPPAAGRTLALEDFPVPGYVKIVAPGNAVTAEQFLRSIDVLLCPTHWPEASGLAARTALAHGVWPVVATGASGAEAVAPGLNGSMVALDGTAYPLSDGLRWILDHLDLVRRNRGATGVASLEHQTLELERSLVEVLGQ